MNQQEDRWESALWIMNADGSRNRFFTRGSSAMWSRDGKRVAYLAEGEPNKSTQLWTRYVDAAGDGTQITRLTTTPADIRWSPDGKWIGFTSLVAATPNPSWKIDMPATPKGGKWTDAPRIVDRLHFKQDRRGFMELGNTHLFVVSAEGGTPRQLTKGDWSLGARFDQLAGSVAYDWTPDGKRIIAEGLRDSTADMNYRDASLFMIDVATGDVRQLTPERGSWQAPVVSPDGRRVAFAGTPYGNYSYRAFDLYVMDVDGRNMRMVSKDFDRDPQDVYWSQDGSTLWFTAQNQGATQLFSVPSAGGTPARLSPAVGAISLGGVSRNGVAAAIRTAPQLPPDVVRIDLATKGKRNAMPDVVQLTRVNEDVLAGVKLADVKELWVTSTGGAKVQGWLVTPPGFDAGKKYPLIMEIHGGPHSMYGTGFNYSFQNFAANGYVVLYTNPRGSTGYGSAFGNAIERRYPGVDYEDLMAAVDTVVKRGFVDTQRMYVGGCSGGGVLSSWVIGHTNRFAAAAVRCPVINWMSFIGQTDVPLFTQNFFAKPFWEDPKPWLEQSSLMYVGNVTTPTVVMTGELDRRTPMPQSEEYYAALKMRGVPAALIRFEGEYHGTSSRPSNYIRTQLYMMNWY
ncbi:MAG TPA: S9 family peptidase, partial [Gemmatimonadaceae bacterium]|nr:S9 family peptidase [Gemmatimonadaceae bacterium]